MRLLWVNGALGGARGNTSDLVRSCLEAAADKHLVLDEVHLSETSLTASDWKRRIADSDAILFSTGTYWDSWGSPLQKFLETITELEGTEALLGKPAGVMVSMHSVGGKEVLSRLQGVLSTLGFLIPPMSGLVLSLTNQEARGVGSSFIDDYWSVDDFSVVFNNLSEAVRASGRYRAWPVDRQDPRRKWVDRSRD